jgi:glycine cleavage system H protein
MSVPRELKYTADHEWLRVQGDRYVMGITDFAQSELGEVVSIELPKIGMQVSQGDTLCVVDSTKAASDVYAPIAGRVVKVNSELLDVPDRINNDSYGQGWLVELEPTDLSQLDKLMDSQAYEKLING